MKGGLRSSTLSKRINCNDASSVSLKEKVDYVESGEAIESSDTDTGKGRGTLGKSRRGRKRKNDGSPKSKDDVISNADREKIGCSSLVSKDLVDRENVESPNKGDCGINDSTEEKNIELHLISKYSDPAEDLAIYSKAGVLVEVGGNVDTKTDANDERDTGYLGEEPLQGRKRTKVENPKKDETVLGAADAEKIELPLIPNCSHPTKDLVISSPGSCVEDVSVTQPIECSNCVDPNAKGDAVIEDDNENGTSNVNKTPLDSTKDFVTSSLEENLEEGRKQEQVECSKDMDFEIDKDTSKLGALPLDTAKDLFPSSESREVKEGSGTEHIESNEDLGVNAKNHTVTDSYNRTDTDKLGKPRRGRKRKKVESPKRGDFVAVEIKEERGSPLNSCGQDAVENSVGFTLQRKVKEEISEFEECKDADKATCKPIKGRRGRKRKNIESYQCNEVKDDKVQIVGRVLRSRTMAMSDGEKVLERESNGNFMHGKIKKEADQEGEEAETESGKSPRPIRRRRKKVKGRRGRPPKVQGQNGVLVSKVICKKKVKIMGSKKTSDRKFPNVKKEEASKAISYKKPEVMRSKKDGDQLGSNIVGASSTKKKLKKEKEDKERKMSRREQQQIVRDQIVSILMKAGWTIEYRPRQSKDYLDAVYVDREGKTHWSVTLAYMKLKQKVESGGADSQTISAYTPIPEETLSILLRVRRVEKKGGKKQKANKEKEVPEKEAKSISDSKKRKKSTKKSTLKGGVESSKGKKKAHKIRRKQNQSARSSHKGEERRGRKPCALLARKSEEGVGPDTDGFKGYNGKRGLLSWMIDLGIVQLGSKVQYMNPSKRKVMLEGKITRDGIHCGCCDEILSMSDFESHSGSKERRLFYNIYLESGISLFQCLADSWRKQVESDRIGFYLVDIDGADPNDDTCNICGDGGDLICCDGCPSTFHQNCLDIEKFPSGEWHCVYCSCKFCGTVAGNTSPRNDYNEKVFYESLTCHMCEEKFHITCTKVKDAITNADSKDQSFCGRKCQEVFERLHALLGVKHELEEGFSWTLLQRCDISEDISLTSAPLKVECNSKLAVAFSIMDECFMPIVDERSGTNMINNVVYGCGSNIRRLNYSGFVTAILERGDEIISAASIRIHGNKLAEMPFIGTRHMYRRQGMCRRLLNAIESALCSLDVEKLVIPAISELLETWTSVFSFEPIEESKRKEMKCMSMVVFPGTDMLQKPLVKSRFYKGNPNIPASGTGRQTMCERLVILPESAAKNTSLDHLTMAHDSKLVTVSEGPTSVSSELDSQQPSEGINVGHDNKLVTVSEDLAGVSSELDDQQTREGIDSCTNAQPDSTTNQEIILGESAATDTSLDHPSNIHDNKCSNARSGSVGSEGAVVLVESAGNDTSLDQRNVPDDIESSLVSQIGFDSKNCEEKTIHVTSGEGNEALVGCE